jgi:hypothetical protein
VALFDDGLRRPRRGASRPISGVPSGLAWCLPAPSAAATLGLRLTWLVLLALGLAWLVSLCIDAEQGRVPVWSAVLGVLLVGAWALATRAWLMAALRVPVVVLDWREATRELPAGWVDAQGQRVKVDVMIDLGLGLLVQCRWPNGVSAAQGVTGPSVRTRWVPAAAASLEVRWRLFHARHEAVASSSLPLLDTQHAPQRQKGSMSAPSSSTTPRRKGQS